MLVRGRQRVGIEVGRVARIDDVGCERTHQERLIEELQRAVDRKDDGEQDRRPQQRQLDQPRKLPGRGAIDPRGLGEVRRDRLQRGVVDHHIVADIFPRHDIGQ